MRLRVTEDYIKHLKKMEGLILVAYKPVGEKPTSNLTIGYGHYGAKPGDVISISQADKLLREDLLKVESDLSDLGLSYLSLSRWTALVDFVFNLGIGAFKRSSLFKLIRSNADDELICSEFGKWIYSGKKVLLGLKRRRSFEANLWRKNV